MTEEVWAYIQEPKKGGSDDFARTTQTYMDTYIALELLHCSYQEYIMRVPRRERLFNQFYVMFKNAREQHAHDEMEQEAEAQRSMQRPDALMGGLQGRP